MTLTYIFNFSWWAFLLSVWCHHCGWNLVKIDASVVKISQIVERYHYADFDSCHQDHYGNCYSLAYYLPPKHVERLKNINGIVPRWRYSILLLSFMQPISTWKRRLSFCAATLKKRSNILENINDLHCLVLPNSEIIDFVITCNYQRYLALKVCLEIFVLQKEAFL